MAAVPGNFTRAGKLLRTFGWVQVAMLVVVAFALVVMPFFSPLPEGLAWVDEAWYPVLIFGISQALLFVAVGTALRRRVRWAKPLGAVLATYALLLVPIGTLFGALALHNLFFAKTDDA
jgi:hypothetical protein